jgi:hypothetical protein
MLDFRRTLWALWLGAAIVGMLVHTPVVLAQIAVSANDNKLMLVNGAATVVQNPAPDTVAIIDLKQFPPKILAEIEVPASVVGPPLSRVAPLLPTISMGWSKTWWKKTS